MDPQRRTQRKDAKAVVGGWLLVVAGAASIAATFFPYYFGEALVSLSGELFDVATMFYYWTAPGMALIGGLLLVTARPPGFAAGVGLTAGIVLVGEALASILQIIDSDLDVGFGVPLRLSAAGVALAGGILAATARHSRA